MKYLFITFWILCISCYIIIEFIVKTIFNMIIFLWDFKIRKQYLPYNKIFDPDYMNIEYYKTNYKTKKFMPYKNFINKCFSLK